MKRNNLYSGFVFLFSPLLIFIHSCFSHRSGADDRNLKFLGLLFFVYFGWTYSVPESSNGDEVRFLELFDEVNRDIHDIGSLVNYIIEGKSPTEFFVPCCAFLSSFIGVQLYFSLLSVTYGFFFIECLVIVKRFLVRGDIASTLFSFLLFLFFSLIYPFWNSINGVRFGTVTMIFLIGLIRTVEKKGFYTPMIFAPFIHFGSLIFLLSYLLILYSKIFAKLNLHLLYGLFFLSFLLNFFFSDFLINIFGSIGDSFSNMESKTAQEFSGYGNQEFVSELRLEKDKLNWNVKLEGKLSYYLPLLFNTLIYIRMYSKGKSNDANLELQVLQKIALSFFIVVNLFSPGVASVERYSNISLMLLIYTIGNEQNIEYLGVDFFLRFVIVIILLALSILKIRGGFDLVDINLIQPVFFAWLNDVNIRIVEIWESTGGFNR